MNLVDRIAQEQLRKDVPNFRSGDTLRVYCKIREGDWNDSVNRAGLEGKGESVMVSCQAVLGLEASVRPRKKFQVDPAAMRICD